jgi:hypothetical protein
MRKKLEETGLFRRKVFFQNGQKVYIGKWHVAKIPQLSGEY